MTSESVLTTQRQVFYRALLKQDWDALADLYADDYMLVRSDTSVLTKNQVLEDLKTLNLVFESIELTGEQVRIVAPPQSSLGTAQAKHDMQVQQWRLSFGLSLSISKLPLA